jgi:hypothetical protein
VPRLGFSVKTQAERPFFSLSTAADWTRASKPAFETATQSLADWCGADRFLT